MALSYVLYTGAWGGGGVRGSNTPLWIWKIEEKKLRKEKKVVGVTPPPLEKILLTPLFVHVTEDQRI